MTASFLTQYLKRSTRWFILFALVATLVGCDQGMKFYAVENWKNQPPQEFLRGLFKIQYAENEGAFLSLLANASPEVRFWTLVVVNSVLLLGLLIYLIVPVQQQAWPFVSLALVLAGGLGNLIDRIRIAAVIDFFNIGIGPVRSGIFNVADMAITAGFLLMFPLVFYGEPGSPPQSVPAVRSPDQGT